MDKKAIDEWLDRSRTRFFQELPALFPNVGLCERVVRLRAKLDPDDGGELITTFPGVGYRMELPGA